MHTNMKQSQVARSPPLPPMFTASLIKEVQDLIDHSSMTGERTTGWEAIQEKLLSAGAAQKDVQIKSEFVGVSRFNRSKLGVGGSEAQVHGSEIMLEGYSHKKASDATAAETPPPPYDADEVKANRILEKRSRGLIPQLVECKYISVGGSHTNTFIRQVNDGVRCVVASLKGMTDADGRLNADLMAVGRPNFKDVLENGMRWFVLHWGCVFAWPSLLPMVQRALNTQAFTGQGEVEMMLYLHSEAAADDWNFDGAIKRAKETHPQCAPYMEVLAAYVKENAGKNGDSEILADLNNFLKAFACDEKGALRTLGGEFIGKLNTIAWGKATKCPRIKNACLMANLGSTKVSDGICKLLLPAHLNMLVSKENREAVLKAEQLMEDARSICDSVCQDAGIRVHALGLLDTRCALHLCKKGKDGEGRVFDSLDEIGDAFVGQLSEALQHSVANPWARSKPQTSPAGSAIDGGAGRPETVGDLKSQQRLAEKEGFVLNANVYHKKEPEQIYTIMEMQADQAVLQQHERDTSTHATYEAFLHEWKVYSGKMAQVLEECTQDTCSPLLVAEWKVAAARGAVAIAMQKHLGKHEKGAYEKLEVYQSKGVVVRATEVIPKGELQLAPASQRLDQKHSVGSFKVCTYVCKGESKTIYAMPHNTLPLNKDGEPNAKPWINHFWMVQVRDDEVKECNMEVKWQEDIIGDFKVQTPVLVNRRQIKKGESLKRQRLETDPAQPVAKNQAT